MNVSSIEINGQFQKALDAIESQKNLFITGKAGTGKSTLLNYFRQHTQCKVVVLAPTGVAALNVQGETIHSFFGFKPDITLEKIKKLKERRACLYQEIEAIIIDEISMVRADLLDYVDRFLRLNAKSSRLPFGGVQMILIGDLYQLPPVVISKEKKIFETHYESPYFFDSRVFRAHPMEMIELEKIYRQKDQSFIELLNAIRNNTVTEDQLKILNSRVGAKLSAVKEADYTVHLTPTNAMASEINAAHLSRLKSRVHTYSAEISGRFESHAYPADATLQLAKEAQVMLLNNDSGGRWVNGTLGRVEAIERDKETGEDMVQVRLSSGLVEDVQPYTWDIFHFTFNSETQIIETETLGSFKQYPLKLAWAVTIHKSQGKTFDRVVINMGHGAFAHGQTYVALSRCTSLEGMTFVKPVQKTHIWTDWRIVRFMTRRQYENSEQNMSLDRKLEMIQGAIESESLLDIVYLKATDDKTRRTIIPREVGSMEYQGKPFTGLQAYCLKRRDERVFRVDRILEMKVVDRNGSG
ncbi:MAG: AAA family ATPase [Elusimicrobia bacterium]|nr:AAA family ATPase [Elusimicrobiota bacterium]